MDKLSFLKQLAALGQKLVEKEKKVPMITLFQDGVIKAASERLGRPLTEREISGVRLIESGLMLEAYETEFLWPATTLESIEANLERMACQTKPFRI